MKVVSAAGSMNQDDRRRGRVVYPGRVTTVSRDEEIGRVSRIFPQAQYYQLLFPRQGSRVFAGANGSCMMNKCRSSDD